ncbi:uncharacterized protein C8R40DRAFT_1070409 [Lentinula edodes]|uniref:uncharacterized protein n=1 Tax=Lentinula edodes TaxID=5353 RepID=UPI001E8CB9F8|nr:uncharacterized protein C8R40DRAFT_1070409 [Lentinula edodes]KAH7874270.1 hypothetical protein C8R40DRAFT_1070409 [Lentinula edodes]
MNLAVVSRKISCFRHNTSLSLLSRVLPVDAHAIQARSAHATATRRRRPANDSIDLDSYSEEAQLKFIRRAQIVGQNQGIDIWAHPVDTLDVAIPYATAPWSRSKFSTVKERLSQWLSNQKNKGKSLFSMMRLVSYDSLPGIDTQSMGFMGALRMPLHLCTSSSTKPTSWIAPLRKILLENYVSVQQALAKHDKEELSRLTQPPYYQEVEKLVKKGKANNYIWTLHREVSPTKIISIRSTEGHLGPVPPPYGNRLLVNALVRFETEQSLEVYDAQGNALHTPEPGASKKGRRVPAEKRQLTEYCVFEKRMYYNTPWQIKERLYPKLGKQPAL